MKTTNRRRWLSTVATAGVGAVGSQLFQPQKAESHPKFSPESKIRQAAQSPLLLKDYQPKSMLHVPETSVPRSKFPNIDFHTHLSWIDRKGEVDVVNHVGEPSEALRVMDAKNIKIMVNLTGGYGPLLEETVKHWYAPHPDRFLVFTEPWYDKANTPDYPKFQADQLEKDRTTPEKHAAG